MELPRQTERLLLASFATVVMTFVAATLLAQYRARAIDVAAVDIAERATPRIIALADARAELQHIPLLATEWLDATDRAEVGQEMEASVRRLEAKEGAHRALSEWPAELRQDDFLRHLVGDVRRATDEMLSLPVDADVQTCARARARVRQAATRASSAVLAQVDEQAERARQGALRIEHIRGRVTVWAYVADAIAMGLSGLLAYAVVRQARRHDELLQAHATLLKQRGDEMEQFSGRVAHDILNPLQVVGLSLDRALQEVEDLPELEHARGVLWRGQAAVQRVKLIVDALLEFARSGGEAQAGARAHVGNAIREVREELLEAAAASGVEFIVYPLDAWVNCPTGVLLSSLENIAWNAIKYMGEGRVRRVIVRAEEVGTSIRLAVRDTGPGLPEGFEADVFRAFARAPSATSGSSLGLGLATVKRVVESLGGRIGVHSKTGAGCEFWFEIPRALAPDEAPQNSGPAPSGAQGVRT